MSDAARPENPGWPGRPGRPGKPDRQGAVRAWLIGGLLALAILPYANALQAGFVYDDAGLVVEHEAVQGPFDLIRILATPYWGTQRAADTALWRPVTTLTFALDDAIADDSARWMHAVNVVLHAGVVLLGFGLAQRLGLRRELAAAAAALFAVHPLHTEAVTWIAGRAELLAALGALTALLAASSAAPRRAAACGLATFLAVGAKESAAFLPFAVAFLGWSRREPARRTLATAGASFAAVLALALLRFAVLDIWRGPSPQPYENAMVGTQLLERLPTVFDAAGRYVALVAWPHPLAIDYAPPILGLARGLTPYGALGIASSIALLGLAIARPTTLEGRAAALTVGAYAVASNLPVVIGTNFAERLFYLPSFGVLLLASALAGRLPLPRGLLAAMLAVVLVAGSLGTWARNRVYRDDLTLADATLAVHPNSPKLSYNRARELQRRGLHAEAIEQAEWTLELRADDYWARIVLVNALVSLGRADEAEARLRSALDAAPRSRFERARLLELFDARGATQQADDLAEQTLALGTREAPWPARAAEAAQRRGDFDLAAQRWRSVTSDHPESAYAWTELGKVAYGAGDADTASRALERAVALDPQRAEAANALSWLLLDEGRDLERALVLAERAVRVDEASADFLDTHARALRASGRCEQALVQAREAAALDPEYATRRDTLERECGAESS